jgi:hypothetical protein
MVKRWRDFPHFFGTMQFWCLTLVGWDMWENLDMGKCGKFPPKWRCIVYTVYSWENHRTKWGIVQQAMWLITRG